MSATPQQPSSPNRILAALTPEEYERLARRSETAALDLGEVVFWPGDALRHVHFPTTAIVSLLTELSDGNGLEVGLVGREGVVGVSAFLGGTETKVATAQGAGEALRVGADALREEFARGGELQSLLLRYTHALMMQISQSVVCNVRHNIPGRLARWLLMYHDRAGRDEFYLTQEFVANMLGVRRAGVSEAAEGLQQMGMISYQRGQITIVDRAKLEAFACECYPIVKQKYDTFLQ
jgi:CRP-like cAMP-binding protein